VVQCSRINLRSAHREQVCQLASQESSYFCTPLYQRHQRYITAHELAERLLQDGDARAIIDAARQQQQDWSVEHLASNMVAWFSQRITIGESEWQRAFERTKINGQWAYLPTQAVTA
jgi:hypothetical protein